MAVLSQSDNFIECEFESDLSLSFGGVPIIHTIEVSPGIVSDKYWKVMRGTFIETTILAAPFKSVIDSLPLPTGAATAANQQTNALTDAQLRATPVPVSATIATTGLATQTGQNTGNASLSSIDSKLTNPLPVSGTVTANTGLTQPLTDVQLRAAAVPVSGTFFQATQPVSGTFFQATQPISAATLPLPSGAATAANQQTNALTDVQLRATAIPVSATDLDIRNLVFATDKVDVSGSTGVGVTGTFFQATQPISASSLPLPSGAATAANQQTNALTDAQLRAVAVPVSGAFFQATQPVSATDLDIRNLVFATDKVDASGTVLGAGTNNIGDVDVLSLPSLPAGTNAIGKLAANDGVDIGDATINNAAGGAAVNIQDGGNSLTVDAPVTTPVFVRLSDGAAAISTLPVSLATNTPTLQSGSTTAVTQATAANLNATVTPIAITKGTQGSTGFTVQRLNDAGRNARHFMLDAYTAAPVAEAVQSVVQWYNNAAVGGTTQPAVVPAGKTLRLTNYTISTKSLATVGSVIVRIRANTAGLGVLASPLVFSMEAGSTAGATTVAMTGGMDTFSGVFSEGLEFPAGTGLAFSMAGYGPTGTLTLQGVTRFQVFGYEY